MNRLLASLAVASTAATFVTTAPVVAYPIDCAIFLCMAGGFPPSAECSAAKAEVIRRITPWPVEPPLQLWRCPMSVDRASAASLGIALDTDGLLPEVRQYRDAVEIYHIQTYIRRRTRDGEQVIDSTQVGKYAPNGDFAWSRASFERGPAWLADAVGGQRVQITECVSYHRDGDCRRHEVVGEENRSGHGVGGFGRLRGVAFRYVDYEGIGHSEFIRY